MNRKAYHEKINLKLLESNCDKNSYQKQLAMQEISNNAFSIPEKKFFYFWIILKIYTILPLNMHFFTVFIFSILSVCLLSFRLLLFIKFVKKLHQWFVKSLFTVLTN